MIRRVSILTCALCLCAATGLVADQHEEAAPPMDMEAAMAMMAQLAEPGEHHDHLSPLAGSWTYTSKTWMAPGAEPMVNEGTGEHEMILGGRFLSTTYHGSFMGTEFTGHGLEGFDKQQGKYVSMWVDSMGTMMMTGDGTCSDDGSTRTMTSTMIDPMSGQEATMKSVYTMTDPDHFTLEMYMVGPEGEFKTMEIAHTRQAAD